LRVIVAVFEVKLPSLAVKVKLSGPTYPAVGV
jgi:hypothetical protein